MGMLGDSKILGESQSESECQFVFASPLVSEASLKDMHGEEGAGAVFAWDNKVVVFCPIRFNSI